MHGMLAMSCACMQVHIVQAMVICTFADVLFYHTIQYTLYSFQHLVPCTHVELLLIHAICVVPKGCVFCLILSSYSYAPWAIAAQTRVPLQLCKRRGGILKIGLHPSRSINWPQKILGYIKGSPVQYRASLDLHLWSRFLSPFLFSTTLSLDRNNQQSGWIVYFVEYSPGYRQSLMWRVAWHHICGIW